MRDPDHTPGLEVAKELVRRRLLHLQAARRKFHPQTHNAHTLAAQCNEASEILSVLAAFERDGSVKIGGCVVITEEITRGPR